MPIPTTISGTARNLSGDCPDIGFTVNGASVQASKSTKFGGGDCKHLKSGATVTVVGLVQSGAISAIAIQISKND